MTATRPAATYGGTVYDESTTEDAAVPRVLVYGPSFDVEWVIAGDGHPRRP